MKIVINKHFEFANGVADCFGNFTPFYGKSNIAYEYCNKYSNEIDQFYKDIYPNKYLYHYMKCSDASQLFYRQTPLYDIYYGSGSNGKTMKDILINNLYDKFENANELAPEPMRNSVVNMKSILGTDKRLLISVNCPMSFDQKLDESILNLIRVVPYATKFVKNPIVDSNEKKADENISDSVTKWSKYYYAYLFDVYKSDVLGKKAPEIPVVMIEAKKYILGLQ